MRRKKMTNHSPSAVPKVMRNHRVFHIPELRLADNLFHAKFPASCSVANCTAACCKFGVYADLAEREKVLANADLIRKHMDDRQEHDQQLWFEDKIYDDTDFPSGKAVGTRAMWYGCVFLDAKGKCALQKTSVEEGMGRYSLKPFYCVAYPITINHGVLMLDEENFLNNAGCCRPDAGGERKLLDVCAEELSFVLGDAGFEELQKLVKMEESQKHG
jgi:Fe-S-cluster containining protein